MGRLRRLLHGHPLVKSDFDRLLGHHANEHTLTIATFATSARRAGRRGGRSRHLEGLRAPTTAAAAAATGCSRGTVSGGGRGESEGRPKTVVLASLTGAAMKDAGGVLMKGDSSSLPSSSSPGETAAKDRVREGRSKSRGRRRLTH